MPKKVVLVSTDVLHDPASSAPYPGLPKVIAALCAQGHAVGLISNRSEPAWLRVHYPAVQFLQWRARQSGEVVQEILDHNKGVALGDVVVLGAKDEDLLMAANARALLVQCAWAPLGEKMRRYGVPIRTPAVLSRVLELLETKTPWFFSHRSDFLDVYALTNAGTKYESNADMVRLADSLRDYLKAPTSRVAQGVLLHLLSSIYATPEIRDAVDVLGYYPSSASSNDETEVMAALTRLVREPLKKRQASPGEPLLIRHTASPRRHVGRRDRTDPASQTTTLCLNPYYRKSEKLRGKTVAILDDYLTYGASFGTAAALLRRAGAAKVIGIAMGKFGNCAVGYDLSITTDPFTAVPETGYTFCGTRSLTGTHTREAQLEFFEKFGSAIE